MNHHEKTKSHNILKCCPPYSSKKNLEVEKISEKGHLGTLIFLENLKKSKIELQESRKTLSQKISKSVALRIQLKKFLKSKKFRKRLFRYPFFLGKFEKVKF